MMVVGNFSFDSTRAASSTNAVPEPSSFAPGASLTASRGSETRLSMWPCTITTSFGRSLPRWIATTLTSRVGTGTRSPLTTGSGRTISRQPPQAAAVLRNSPSAHLRAAPIPRFGSVCEDSVCRVPKLTSFSTSARNRASEIASSGAATAAVETSSGIRTRAFLMDADLTGPKHHAKPTRQKGWISQGAIRAEYIARGDARRKMEKLKTAAPQASSSLALSPLLRVSARTRSRISKTVRSGSSRPQARP